MGQHSFRIEYGLRMFMLCTVCVCMHACCFFRYETNPIVCHKQKLYIFLDVMFTSLSISSDVLFLPANSVIYIIISNVYVDTNLTRFVWYILLSGMYGFPECHGEANQQCCTGAEKTR